MDKPTLLRAALVAALPEYLRDPDKLLIFVDKGRLVSRLTPGLGYEWRYALVIDLYDVTGSPDRVAVPLLLWLREHQPERFLDFAREDSAIGFAADLISISPPVWDLRITFELTEAVTVMPDPQGYRVEHLPEPKLPDAARVADPLLAEIDGLFAPQP